MPSSTSCNWIPGARASREKPPPAMSTDGTELRQIMKFSGIYPSGSFLLILCGLLVFLLCRDIGPPIRKAHRVEPLEWVCLTEPEQGSRFYSFEHGRLLGHLVGKERPRLSSRLSEGCRQMALEPGTGIRLSPVSGSAERSCSVFPLPEGTRYLLGMLLNVNRAGQAELELLPGIGPGLAKRMIEVRETVGCFGSMEDLLRVPGIGRKTLERIQGRICLRAGGDAPCSAGEASGSEDRA